MFDAMLMPVSKAFEDFHANSDQMFGTIWRETA
jgi:hypothetical protein